MSRAKLSAYFGLAVAALSSGCGGTEPLSVVGGGNGLLTQLSLPISEAGLILRVDPYNMSGAGTQVDGLDIVPTISTSGATVLAPGPGIVTAVDNTPGAAAVYIYHNSRLTSRISRMQVTSVQAGAIVQTGSVLGVGTTISGMAIRFAVFYENSAVCPLSHLTPAAQTLVANRLQTFLSPCL